jgi:hypothetical protein
MVAMRLLMFVVMVLVVATSPVEAGPWACYTEQVTMSDTPNTRCSQECEQKVADLKEDKPPWLKSVSSCSPATASVYCLNPGSILQTCFADLETCKSRDPKSLVEASKGLPLPDRCFEMKLDGTVLSPEQRKAAAASTSSTSSTSSEAPSKYACYTVDSALRPKPRTYCDEDCEGAVEIQKQTSGGTLKSITGCTPYSGSVFCLHYGSPLQGCYQDAETCLDADPRVIAARFQKEPVIDTCVEVKPDGTVLSPEQRVAAAEAEAAASSSSSASTESSFEAGAYQERRRDVLVYGGLLVAGEEMNNESGGALGVERRAARGLLAHGLDANLHYVSGMRGVGGYVALRAGAGFNWSTGSFGLTVGLGYGGVELSAVEIPFELFLNGNLGPLGILIRYEQVHRFVDASQATGPDVKTTFLNASGFALWAAYGGARNPRVCVGIRVQERDGTDAAFFNLAVGLPSPALF